jgi:hypothetical protein
MPTPHLDIASAEATPADKVLPGAKSITIAIWLDINGGLDFYPEYGPITKTFKVDDLDRTTG